MGQACTRSTVAPEDTFYVEEVDYSIPVRSIRKFGWKRDLPDFRDRSLALPAERLKNLPAQKDLRPKEHFPIYDQANLGSCTANAIGAAFHFDQVKEEIKDFTPCRLFIYYNARSMEGNVEKDSGAYLRDGIKSLHKIGVCAEKSWPYLPDKFAFRPPEECYKEAKSNRATEYARVPQTLEDMKGCINAGFPFVFGFTVVSSFMSRVVATTGNMVMPQPTDYICGGHAVQACGYDDSRKVFIVRNSWGEAWGDKGYFYMPYDYITNQGLASDFWVIRFVNGDPLPTKG